MARSKVSYIFFIMSILYFSGRCFSDEPIKPTPLIPKMADFDVYEGINPKEIGNFWEKWKLVTVRYRKDVDEQRFVYANSIAWNAMKHGRQKFPDGSMFGKIAFKSKTDPLFPVSAVPDSVTRIQVMKKNSLSYPKTGGWGYAIYPAKRREGQSPDQVVQACFACHNIVPQKDYIFSEALFLGANPQKPSLFLSGFKEKFQMREVAQLTVFQSKVILQLVPNAKKVKLFQIPLFNGSLSESSFPISQYAGGESIPYFLVDDASKQFLLAYTLPASSECAAPVELITLMKAPDSISAAQGAVVRIKRKSLVCKDTITNLLDTITSSY